MIDAARANELAQIFAGRAKAPTNIIDPPFDCVTTNLKPTTYAEIAEVLRHYADCYNHNEN